MMARNLLLDRGIILVSLTKSKSKSKSKFEGSNFLYC